MTLHSDYRWRSDRQGSYRCLICPTLGFTVGIGKYAMKSSARPKALLNAGADALALAGLNLASSSLACQRQTLQIHAIISTGNVQLVQVHRLVDHR